MKPNREIPFQVKKSSILAIIVNWNTKSLLRQCLESVRMCNKDHPLSVVVVDNGSSDGSAEMVKNEFPECILIRNQENVGFARANNQAFRLFPQYHYYLLLNSDATVTAATIGPMIDIIEEHSDIAAVGPSLKLPNGQYQAGGAGWGPSAIHSLNTFMLLAKISRRFRGLFIVQKQYKNYSGPVMVDWLAGACTIIRAQTITDVGPFDERYFIYGEDAEWCWRARRKGWRIAYLPYASATHHFCGSNVYADSENTNWFVNLVDAVRLTSSTINYRLFLLFGALGYFLRIAVLAPFSLGQRGNFRRARLKRHIQLFKDSLHRLFLPRPVERNDCL